jgi:hypothetical protein
MASWGEFEAAAPDVAAMGRRLLFPDGTGEAFLTTVAGAAGLPRTHPINIGIVGDRLVAFLLQSPKATDLASDARFALHAHQARNAPHEFLLRGRAMAIDDPETRAQAAAAWYFEISDQYRLFEFGIEHAVLGERGSPDDWPPRYTSWRSTAA